MGSISFFVRNEILQLLFPGTQKKKNEKHIGVVLIWTKVKKNKHLFITTVVGF